MQQGMKQSMAATAAMQMFMRTLQATNMELAEITAQALASNPALEELPPPEPDATEAAIPDFEAARRHEFFMESLTEEPTLRVHLEEQIRHSALPRPIEEASLAIIPYLNQHGFFTEPPEEAARQMGMPQHTFQKALQAIQDLEPAGVGAADLRESLILQLQRKGEHGGLPMLLLQNHWSALVCHRYAEAAKELDVEEEAVVLAAKRIARLNPDPGSRFSQAELHTITPDVEVLQQNGKLSVTLTGQHIPNLTLSAQYRDMMAEHADKPELRRYLSRCFREGRELIKAINDRQHTILAVARAIVARQESFFLRGPSFLLPMKMEEIANDTGLHVSTISRAVRGKFLKCQWGIYELRSYFSAAIPADNGDEGVTALNVQARLKALIAEENPRKPLSDAKLEKKLADEGIIVARRTIAKYREALKILPAALRKQH